MVSAAVFDYNGTIVANPNEGPLWKYVGIEHLKASLPFHPFRAIGLLIAFKQLTKLNGLYRQGKVNYDRLYELFNERVLRTLEEELLKAITMA